METRDLRIEILRAAKHLIIEHGYHGLSMRQVAESLGVSKAALYYHFNNKEELLLEILNEELDNLERIIDFAAAQGVTCRQQITIFVKKLLAQPAEQRALVRLASQEMAQLSLAARLNFNQIYHAKFIGKIQAILEQGMRTGELKRVDLGLATWVLLGMMYPYFYSTHARDIPPAADVLEQLLLIYLDGLATD